MSILKRAFLYIGRKPARSIVLALILFAMGLLMLAGISIQASAKAAAREVRRTMTSGFELIIKEGIAGDSLFTGYTNENNEFVRQPKVDMLTQDEVDQILSVEGVTGRYSETGRLTLYTGLDVFPGLFSEGYEYLRSADPGEIGSDELSYEEELLSTETNAKSQGVFGIDESERQPFFMNGAVELVAGRHLKSGDDKKAIISDALARRNGLSIGDTITMFAYDFISGERYSSPYAMEIVGLFQTNFKQEISPYTAESDIIDNLVFTDKGIDEWDYAAYIKHYGGQVRIDEQEVFGGMTFFVDDPLKLDAVMEEVRGMDIVDWDFYVLEREDQDYQTSAGPLSSVANLSTLLFVAAAAGCFAIMALLLTMWTRSRRLEIGILASVGTRKSGIIAQFILECLVIALIAFLIAALVAGPVTGAIGDAMTGASVPSGGEPYEVSVILETREIDVAKAPGELPALAYAASPAAAVAVVCLMAGIAALSVLVSANSIARMKPREILTRR